MTDEPRPVVGPELDELTGQTVEILGMGADAMAFRAADGRTLMATLCLGCGMHVGYYEIDPSILADDSSLAGAG